MRKIFITGMFLSVFGSMVYADSSSDIRIGFGGLYSTHQSGVGGKEFNATGGYLTLIGRDFSKDGRFFGDGGGELAFARSVEKGSSSGNLYFFGEAHLKYGVNLSSNNRPLYLNLGYSWDSILTDFASTPESQKAVGLRTNLHLVGIDLQGFIHRGERLTLEYNVGYWYPFYGAYYGDGVYSRIKDYSQVFKAQVGFAYKISPKISYFMNLKAKYYDLAKSHLNSTFTYPKAQNLVGMLELGLQF